jgi:hypothetical protein
MDIPYVMSLELVVILARLLTMQQVHIQPVVTNPSSTTSRPTSAPKTMDAALPAAWQLQLLIGCVVVIASVAVVCIEVVSALFILSVDMGSSPFVSEGAQDTMSMLMLEYLCVFPSLLVQVTMSSPSIMQVKFLILCISLISCGSFQSVHSPDPAVNRE